MKILVLCSQAKNTGAVYRAEYIHKYLKKHGVESEYIYPPLNSMPFMLDYFLSMFYYFFAVMNRKPEAVIIQKPYPNTILPALMLKAAGSKIIIDIDDLDHGYRKGLLAEFIKWLQYRLVKTASLITSHNDALIKLIEKEHPQRRGGVYRLSQCVDFEIFSPPKAGHAKVKSVKSRFKGKKLLFYMANLNIASCLDSIFDAMARVKEPHALLLVAGGGPLLNKYKRMVFLKGLSAKVVFLGPLGREEVVAYIMAADLCLVYYKEEKVNLYRASMKLREYLAMAKPVVATAVGEIKNFSKMAYLCRATPASFANEIDKRLKILDKRPEKAYKVIRRDYDWNKEIMKFKNFLEKEKI